ncbi:hypothetical protein HHK36_017368 [Tetracentron sinense]|uniref:Protein FAR1-RELATED SEQUENCE n=1 Tax=Tetracentron sinense TaxID=13715 RepID=A0A834Z4A3_TETSI|nr:hypothetical protein HHK36_017368 [Tetracentron sinense]
MGVDLELCPREHGIEDVGPNVMAEGEDEMDLSSPTTAVDSFAIMGDTNLKPRKGMVFESNEAAYSFYKEYAKSEGFGTAKLSSRRSRRSKEFIDAKFTCARYGRKHESADVIKPRPSPKIGCNASMHVKRRDDGKWFVYSFIKDHNHELLPAQAHFFRSHKSINPINKNEVRVRTSKISTVMPNIFSGYQNFGCLENYIRNQFDKGRSLALEEGDAQVMLEHFMHMQEENPKFVYSVDLNEEQCLRNAFWIDAKGRNDHINFGDVVTFDTTYITYKYKIPFASFIGVNHHFQPTLLGCALIADETTPTFVWLMRTWLRAMGGRAPRMILTDQDKAMKAAVAEVFPKARHCFCLWHILEKIPQKLDHVIKQHESFMTKFNKCIYSSWTDEQFEKRWWKMVDRFELKDDEWIQSLYEDREKWVPTYIRDVCFAGMSTSQRSESINSFLDIYVHRETTLKEFVEQYKVVLQDRYEEEAKADFDGWHERPELMSPSPFEKQMLTVYTHEIFKKFQVEVLGAAACHLKKEMEDETTITFRVKDFEKNREFIVAWSEKKSDISCLCRSFEYKGFLCRHAIIVLQISGVFSIPSHYILKRWTKDAKSRHTINQRSDEMQSRVQRYNDLCRRAIILGEEGSLSQDSYDVAFCAIEKALRQCVSVNNSIKSGAKPSKSARVNKSIKSAARRRKLHGVHDIVGENQANSTTSILKALYPQLIKTKGAPSRVDAGIEKTSYKNNANKKRKLHSESKVKSVAVQDSLQQMEQLSSSAPTIDDLYGSQQNVQGMMGQLNSVAPNAYYGTRQSRHGLVWQ